VTTQSQSVTVVYHALHPPGSSLRFVASPSLLWICQSRAGARPFLQRLTSKLLFDAVYSTTLSRLCC